MPISPWEREPDLGVHLPMGVEGGDPVVSLFHLDPTPDDASAPFCEVS